MTGSEQSANNEAMMLWMEISRADSVGYPGQYPNVTTYTNEINQCSGAPVAAFATLGDLAIARGDGEASNSQDRQDAYVDAKGEYESATTTAIDYADELDAIELDIIDVTDFFGYCIDYYVQFGVLPPGVN